jgi:hypothetical protein
MATELVLPEPEENLEQFTVEQVTKPNVLFLVVGNDGLIFSCRDQWVVHPDDPEAGRWIRFTLRKLGFSINEIQAQQLGRNDV